MYKKILSGILISLLVVFDFVEVDCDVVLTNPKLLVEVIDSPVCEEVSVKK